MGLLGSLLKCAVNIVVSPIVVVTDVLKGDFENTKKVVENVINSTEDIVENLLNGDLL